MQPAPCDPVLSVVIPVFNEAAQIAANLDRIQGALQALGLSYELVVIDDGSGDNTWSVLLQLQAYDCRLRAFRLSRNFGKEAALCTGLDHCIGAACIIMDSDLQHPPELISEMVRLWRDENYPIVEAVKRTRSEERAINRWGARVFYGLMAHVAGMDLHQASDFKLLDARIVAAWRLLNERQTFFRGLTTWLGFPRAQVFFEVPERAGGTTKWSVFNLVRLALRAITSFSSLPLQLVTSLGIVFFLGAVPLGIEALYLKLRGDAVDGFTTVILLLLIIGSTLMVSLGIIGTYIARIFEEVKGRPRYIIADSAESAAQQRMSAGTGD